MSKVNALIETDSPLLRYLPFYKGYQEACLSGVYDLATKLSMP